MKFPSVVISAVLAGLVALLQHLLGHVGDFHLPELYAPIAVVILNTAIKMVQERQSPPSAAARGMGEEATPGYWKRVLYK
jgi:hypothetical protein